MDILAIRRGRAPNCSSGGSVIGLALVSATAASAILSFWAHRLLQWKDKHIQSREEDFGHIIQSHDPPARIFVGAEGQSSARKSSQLRAPTEVHVALTHRCPVSCNGCYLNASPKGEDTEWEQLIQDIDALAEQGVFEIALGGGEALLHPRILELAKYIRSKKMIPNLTCSGFGIQQHCATELAAVFGQINISIDGPDRYYHKMRGWKGYSLGIKALEILCDAGARVGVNTVISRPLLEEQEDFWNFAQELSRIGIQSWQWLRYKPQGRAKSNYNTLKLTPAQIASLFPLTLKIEREFGLELRWDCAMFPFLAMHQLSPQRLEQLGVVGCIGSERLWARDIKGHFAPCSFVESDPRTGDLASQWKENHTLQQWREQAKIAPEPCQSCHYQKLCRSGCKVVSAFVTGDPLAPDPECPRVAI